MRVWLPQFSPRHTELTSGLFGSLVGKPLQCCSRCRRERADAHRWRYTRTGTRAHTCAHTQGLAHAQTHSRAVHITLATSIRAQPLWHQSGRMCTHAYRCECKYRCGESLFFFKKKKPVRFMHAHTHIDTKPSSLHPPPPDGDRVAADVAGRAGALLAQVACCEQLAQVRHSWELEPQGKCSCWLG